MFNNKKIYAVVGLLMMINLNLVAQQKSLTDDQYFKGNFKGITQSLPAVTRWTDNSHFLFLKEGKSFIVDASNGAEREATDADKAKKDSSKPKAYSDRNDLFIKINGELLQLTNDEEKESNPTMSPDGNYVAFTKKNDLYTINIKTKKQTRLTEDGSDVIMNGYASWVYTEEILGRSSEYNAFWWSPDSKFIAFFRTDDSQVPVFTLTDDSGQHGRVETVRYPKVGDKNPQVKIGFVIPEARSGDMRWAEFNPREDQYFGMPYWKPDGSALLVQWMSRKQNNLKIWDVDPKTSLKELFYNETQKTWVDLDDEGKRITFLENGKGFILFSDSSGWRHMYYYGMNGKLINQITSGRFTVTDLNYVDEKKGIVYFTARKENTARRDLYKINLDGKKMQRLTFGEYNHSNINLSPDGSYFITTYSNASTPNKMSLVSSANGKVIKDIADAKAADFNNYQLAKTELVRVKSDDGLYDLPMKVTWPLEMDKSKRYPVVIYVYGGPNAGTVMDTWSMSGTQQWYAKEGLIQVAMDHRASGHFGKEGENYMYHNLGYWEMKDYTTMVKWLIANGNADSTKVCISGFSYGGYMTCYALTYGASVFTHGMAGGSVTDWSLYDTHYTERYMGTLADNAEGYKNSSPLTYVDRYKGMLQIVHGVIDDNVHMQNSLQLIAKLEDLKKDFEFMLYPGGRHGWPNFPNRGAHFQNLKTKFIYRYLLEKEVPKGLLK